MKKIYIAIFVSTLSVGFAFGQNTGNSDDLETWTSVRLRYNASKKWAFELQEQLRMKENSSVTDQYFTQLTARYKLTKNLSLGAGLRYIKRNDTQGKIQGFEDHFRYHFDLGFKHSLDRFAFNHRLRFQNKNELGVSEEEGDFAKKNFRFKSSIVYNIRKWKLDPKVSAEIFNKSHEGGTNGFNKYRLTFGTSYNLKKAGEISLYYRMEKELNTFLPKKVNIIGFNYTYALNN
jgi:hypothetical protein